MYLILQYVQGKHDNNELVDRFTRVRLANKIKSKFIIVSSIWKVSLDP